MPRIFTSSCKALGHISPFALKANSSAMLPAAGTVVTEMNTPVRPPDLAEVSDSTPAAPAITATMNDHLSGLSMKWVAGRGPGRSLIVIHPARDAANGRRVRR
jgi:hypothetical protein